MQKYNGQLIRQFASNITGNAASGVTVTVRRQSDAGLATLYVENNIAGATLPNPITTGVGGHFAFYAADGVYTLSFSDTTPQQVIQLQDLVGLQEQFDSAVMNAGYIPSGTFSAGATLTQANQVLSDGSSYWRWDGSFPKTVTAGSAPTPTGVGGWIVVSDFALRGDLNNAASTVPIGSSQAQNLGFLNKTTSGGAAKNSSFILGDLGVPSATAPTRTSWTYNGSPTTGTNGLFIDGNYMPPTVLGSTIFQGRSGYYSYFTSSAEVASSMGGDNYVDQLAGLAYAFHVDLLKDTNGLGSHGAAFGGSWKRLRGDYSGSFAGTQHVVSGQNAVVLGGNQHSLGSEADALLSRRSSIVGGQLCVLNGINAFMYSTEQSSMTGAHGGILGGITHTNAATQSVIIGGNNNEHTSSAIRSVTLGGQRNRTTAFMAATLGSDALNDVDCSLTQANGRFVNQGDCQTHYVVGRRLGAAGSTTVDISSQGGGGAPYLYTPRANSIMTFDFNVNVARTDVIGQTASFKVRGSITNIGGALTIKAQTTTVDHRDDAAYNCVLALAGGSTAVVLRGTVPSTSHVTRWNASGTITVTQAQ